MQAILKAVDNSMKEDEVRYEVYYDEDDFEHSFNSKYAIDFDSEAEKQSYMNKFLKEELFAFGLVAMKVCKCCSAWSEKDSLWGIHSRTPEEALEYYKGYTA